MPIIQITNNYKDEVLEIVRKCTPDGFVIRTLTNISEKELASSIADADYILASGRVKIDQGIIQKAEHLKMIQRTGVGLDSLDLDAIKSAGIPLYVNQGVNAQSVAEHTLLLILACLRKLTLLDRNSKKGIWQKQAQGITTFELSEKTVGIIGMGHIGQRVSEMLKAFGAKVIYYDNHRLTAESEHSLSVEFAEPEILFSRSDIISLHCALTEETFELINKKTIALMKDGIVIINTARGGLINEDDLYEAIISGKISFAGLDVHKYEPFSPDDRLVLSDRVIATPHLAGVTHDSFHHMMEQAMRNIDLFDKGDYQAIEQYRLI